MPAPAARGARAVLEVRSREVPFILEHGQIVGRLVFEKMLERPESLYGQGIGSNYQAQGLKLSKHFRVTKRFPIRLNWEALYFFKSDRIF